MRIRVIIGLLLGLILGALAAQPAYAQTPSIGSLGPGCDNWDCIWIVGANFSASTRVVVYSADWAHGETYYGSAWQTSPGLDVNGTGDWLAFQLSDANIRGSFGWSGVHVLVVNADESTSSWESTGAPAPSITSGNPTCADSYCIQLTGTFPLNAYVDFRAVGSGDIIANAYTDLVVTATEITLRLNSVTRSAYDSTGINAWVVNPAVANWSSHQALEPLDRSIAGYVDDVYLSGDQYYIRGWACAKTQPGSVNVDVFAGGAAGTGTHVFSGTADLTSEPAVAEACNSTGSSYRYNLAIPHGITQTYGGQPFYVHGISPLGYGNLLLTGSGSFNVPAIDRSVIGNVDGVSLVGDNYYLNGWACAKTYAGSIDVHIYLGADAWNSGTYGFYGTANAAGESGLATVCNSSGSSKRFSIAIPSSVIQAHPGKSIYVHGISPYGLAHLTIGNSGSFGMPTTPATAVSGIYWKKDYLRDTTGSLIGNATPAP